MAIPQNYLDCAEHFRNNDTDVIVYSGGVDRDGYEQFCKILQTPRKANLLLVLSTLGGDPNAGYRIARAAIHHYGAKNFKILIPQYCKSAGTLICIGAHSLVMADQAELGPLDVQLRKQDELFQRSSGLNILRGVTYLQNEALQSFMTYMLEINGGGGGLSTKVASEISSKLVIGLYEPLFAQVDPVKLGEMNAALEIAKHYGERLNERSSSLKSDSLTKLVMGYPTHGFVIDRSEARVLFERVEKPNEEEKVLCDFIHDPVTVRAATAASVIVIEFTAIFTPTHPPKDSDEPLPQPHVDPRPADNEGAEVRPEEPDVRPAEDNEPK